MSGEEAAAPRPAPPGAPDPSHWTAAHVAAIGAGPLPAAPPIDAAALEDPLPGHWLWDFWPVQHPDGSVAEIAGGALWMALCAPAAGEPVGRHGRARIRLLHRARGAWRDLGPLLPDGFGPGAREWSGSALLDGGRLRLFYTAAGRAGETAPGYEQRLVQTTATLSADGLPRDWTPPRAIVASDGDWYHPADQREGRVGAIKAFRDPGFFRDPADGAMWIFFTGSAGGSASPWNGVIGAALADDAGLERWTLLPPLLSADGLNNELERPHMLVADGRYYLFWSTQRSVFAPGGPAGPTGLYAAVGPSPAGPFAPVAGTGLVLANPPAAPDQAYSWLVLPDGSVTSFADYPAGSPRFAGAPAPTLRLRFAGDRVLLA